MTGAATTLRLDKWLWHARFCKSRTLAAGTISDGAVRLNGVRVQKPAQPVGPGDVLTLALAGGVHVVEVLACGTRRGPAEEARTLYRPIAPSGA